MTDGRYCIGCRADYRNRGGVGHHPESAVVASEIERKRKMSTAAKYASYINRETKQVRQYEFENFEISYAAYKALNGNSFIDKIYEEVHEWEVIA